jgi:tripartite-type tricarboxylate transporter receptor subunit TctC
MAPRLLLLVALLIPSFIGAASAQSYPNAPIQVITPFSPGNVVDLMARAAADELAKPLGQQVYVVNKEGAAGMIAYGELARAAADGLTIMFAPQGQLTLQPHLRKKLPFDPARIDPICQIFEVQFAVVVGEKSPFKTFVDLVDEARRNPGKLNWGVSGIGSIPHLQWHMLERTARIDTTPVPYKNYALVAPETATGQLDFSVMAIGSFGNQPLRVLLTVDDRRSPKFPDVPAAKELGYSVSPAGGGGIFAPMGLPPTVRSALAAACADIVKSSRLKAVFDRLGTELVYRDSRGFAQQLATDHRIKGEAARALNLQVE